VIVKLLSYGGDGNVRVSLEKLPFSWSRVRVWIRVARSASWNRSWMRKDVSRIGSALPAGGPGRRRSTACSRYRRAFKPFERTTAPTTRPLERNNLPTRTTRLSDRSGPPAPYRRLREKRL